MKPQGGWAPETSKCHAEVARVDAFTLVKHEFWCHIYTFLLSGVLTVCLVPEATRAFKKLLLLSQICDCRRF